jgi:hypothetical protein
MNLRLASRSIANSIGAWRLCITLCLCFFSNIYVSAQYQEKAVNLQSPNATGFAQVGEVPVNLFTGQPSINIPILNVSTAPYSLPISLSYNATGFRPDLHSGWVGLNWNLSAGGVITRRPNDLIDEFSSYNDAEAGFYYNHDILNNTSWNQSGFIQNLFSGGATAGFGKDTEPDEFSFNFMNYSGSFYLNDKGEWTVESDQNIKILFNGTFVKPPIPQPYQGNDFYSINNGWLRAFSGFTIITPDGSKFIFGGTTDAIEFSIPMFGQTGKNSWIANAWHLTKIIWPNGKELIYTYKKNKDKDGLDVFIASLTEYVATKSGKLIKNDNGTETPCSQWYYSIPFKGIYDGDLISPVYLSSIESANEKVTFEISPSTELKYGVTIFQNAFLTCCVGQRDRFFVPYLERSTRETNDYEKGPEYFQVPIDRLVWYKLDKIKVFNKVTGVDQAEYRFTYNNSITERLMLQSVQEFGKDGVSLPATVFGYNATASTYVPDYISRKIDHWGFYNGMTTSDPTSTVYFQQREATDNYPSLFILNSIKYPTGGFVKLTFENHYYRKSIAEIRNAALKDEGANKIAGGLRIKKIAISDGINTNKDIVKEYFYVKGYTPAASIGSLQSSGILGGIARYQWVDYNVKTTESGITYEEMAFASGSVLPASNNSYGSHIGYSEVVEKIGNGGYTLNRFTNFDSGADYLDELGEGNLQPQRTAYERYTSKEYKRGKLLSKSIYDATGKIVRNNTYQYSPVLPNNFVKLVKADLGIMLCTSEGADVRLGVAYKKYLTTDVISSATLSDYSSTGSSVNTQQSFTYDAYKNVIEERTTGSDGKIYLTTYKFPYDFVSFDVDYIPCRDFEYPCQDDCRNASANRDELFQCYSDCANALYDCRLRAEEQAAINNAYLGMTKKNLINQSVERRQYMIVNGTQYLLGAILNTFVKIGTDKYYIDKLYQYTAETPQTTDLVGTTYTSQLNFDAKYELKQSFKYDAYGNVLEATKENDIKTAVIWDYNYELPIAEATNCSLENIAYTGFETVNFGNWLNVKPANILATDARAGGKCYNMGASVISKPATAALKYFVSYWSKNGPLTISGTTSTASEPPVNGWTYYIHSVSGVSNISVSGARIIDEIRVWPQESFITTYTHNFGNGISSKQDTNGLIQYLEYDQLRRLKRTRDDESNVLTDYQIHYKN